jgi:hypothetical protein
MSTDGDEAQILPVSVVRRTRNDGSRSAGASPVMLYVGLPLGAAEEPPLTPAPETVMMWIAVHKTCYPSCR